MTRCSPKFSSRLSFDMLPEEITEQILSLCVTAPFEPPPPRPLWLKPSPPPNSQPVAQVPERRVSPSPRTRIAPLLVSKKFHRISLPHYYSTLHITSPTQPAAFLATLHAQPRLGQCVRRLVTSGIFGGLAAILQKCKNIRVIDVCLDLGPAPTSGVDRATEDFCDALDSLGAVKHLTLRKAPNAYLTVGRIRYMITRLAATIEKWTSLESTNIAFRISDDVPAAILRSAPVQSSVQGPLIASAPSPVSLLSASPMNSPPRSGPISLLAAALSNAPSLHTFATQLPSLWNESILCISQNPSLEKIVLGDPRTGVMITGLFMTEAKKHARLVELIKAGTPMVRTRAQTLGNFGTLVCNPPANASSVVIATATGAAYLPSASCTKPERGQGLTPLRSNSMDSTASSAF